MTAIDSRENFEDLAYWHEKTFAYKLRIQFIKKNFLQ